MRTKEPKRGEALGGKGNHSLGGDTLFISDKAKETFRAELYWRGLKKEARTIEEDLLNTLNRDDWWIFPDKGGGKNLGATRSGKESTTTVQQKILCEPVVENPWICKKKRKWGGGSTPHLSGAGTGKEDE